MLKNIIREIFESKGFTINRQQYFESKDYGNIYAPVQSNFKLGRDITETIMEFYVKIPPFYTADISEALKIAGAWRYDLLNRRKSQLAIIQEGNIIKYEDLLHNMFRNELVTGLLGIAYYDEKLAGRRVPATFIESMDAFRYLTGKLVDDLAYSDFGNRWGYKTEKGIINLGDPNHGIKANNILNILNFLHERKKGKLTLVDLGSGYGGDIEKVARWFNRPIRIILVDIPINLTTAYAYISSGFGRTQDYKLYLVDTASMLKEIISNPSGDTEFIFVPSIFVEVLQSLEINLLHNSASFSEMDFITIEFYLKTLVNENTDFVLEINSNTETLNTGSHLEIPSSKFPVPKTHSLLSRTPTWRTPKGHRYLQSLYINNRLMGN